MEKIFEFKVNQFVESGRLQVIYPKDVSIDYILNESNLIKDKSSSTIIIKNDLLSYLSAILKEPIYKASVHVANSGNNYTAWMSFEFNCGLCFSTPLQFFPQDDWDKQSINKKFKDIQLIISVTDLDPLITLQAERLIAAKKEEEAKKETEKVADEPKKKEK